MSSLALMPGELPRPVHYAERPDRRRSTLDRIANDLVGHLVVAGGRQRARGLQGIVRAVDALDAEFRALDAAGLEQRRREIALALRRHPGFPDELIAQSFALMNARPVTQAGSERPERKKSLLLDTDARAVRPIPSTNTK